MPIIALDIETSSLSASSGVILQIAAWVVETGENFTTFVFPGKNCPGEWGAFRMHHASGLIDKAIDYGKPPYDVVCAFDAWLRRQTGRAERITFLGKNLDFDISWLRHHGYGCVDESGLVRRRRLDVGNLLYEPHKHADRVPDLKECAVEVGLVVSDWHDARVDVEVCVRAYRRRYGLPDGPSECPSFTWRVL